MDVLHISDMTRAALAWRHAAQMAETNLLPQATVPLREAGYSPLEETPRPMEATLPPQEAPPRQEAPRETTAETTATRRPLPPPRKPTIYMELMKKHDRMGTRYLPGGR